MRYALRQLLAVLVAVAVLVGEGASAQALEHSFVADAVQRVAPAVVRIDTERTVERQPLTQRCLIPYCGICWGTLRQDRSGNGAKAPG